MDNIDTRGARTRAPSRHRQVVTWPNRLGAHCGPRSRRGGGERRRAPASGKAQAQPRVAGGLAAGIEPQGRRMPGRPRRPSRVPDASVGRPWPWCASWGRLETFLGRGPTAHGHSLPSSGTRSRREDLLAMGLPADRRGDATPGLPLWGQRQALRRARAMASRISAATSGSGALAVRVLGNAGPGTPSWSWSLARA
jgi:hypothetical protein